MAAARRHTHLLLQPLEGRVAPAVFMVTNAGDAGAGSLRQAIIDANAAATDDTINFSSFFNTARTITLQSALDRVIDKTTINGPGASLLTVQRNPSATTDFRVFDLSAEISLSGVTVTNGSSPSNRRGGGIRVRAIAIATIADCVITGNTSALAGGGIFVQANGTLTVRNCTISGNTVTAGTATTNPPKGGGGLAMNSGAKVTLDGCTVSGNTSSRSGGGVYVGPSGDLTVRNSVISGNSTGTGSVLRHGGGIYFRDGGILVLKNSTVNNNDSPLEGGGLCLFGNENAGTFTVSDSTIFNNSADNGAGVRASFTNGSHSLTVQNSTVVRNTAVTAGGGASLNVSAGASLSTAFVSTVAAFNTAPTSPDVAGTANFSFGLVRTQSGATLPNYATQNNLPANTDPLFVGGAVPTLANNGGPTRTLALQAGSPLINAGANPANLAHDQRGPGFPRAFGPTDIGAYEVVTSGTPTAVGTFADLAAPAATYSFQVTYADDAAINVATIGANDLRVTGPNGFDQVAEFVGVNNAANGTPRTATYRVTGPGGTFTSVANGTYTAALLAGAVADTSGNVVPAGTLDTFQVAIAVGGTFIVTNANDSGTGSLRAALDFVNSFPTPGDAVVFDPTFFNVPRTINLTSGRLLVGDGVTITGPGSGLLTVRRDPAAATPFRVFNVNAPNIQTVTISGATISGGSTAAAATAGVSGAGAGLLMFNDVVTLNDVVVTGNVSGTEGGGIAVASYYYGGAGTLIVRNSTISGNRANGVSSGNVGGSGGGIYFAYSGSLLVENSTISGNTSANNSGGGVYFYGTIYPNGFVVRNSTIAGNTAATRGGGLYLQGALVGTATIQNSTIAGNTANGTGQGGGVASFPTSGVVSLTSTVVAFNAGAAGPDVFGPVTAGTSLIRTQTGATITNAGGNLAANTDPLFVGGATPTLANNGGPTRTIALQAASPLMNVGSNPAGLTTDQRGFGYVRQFGTGVDIGAFEVQVAPRVTGIAVNADEANPTQRSRVTSITVTFSTQVTFAGAAANAFVLSRIGGGTVGGFTATVATVGGVTVVTLGKDFIGAETVGGSLVDGRYTITVLAAQVSAGGVAIDGDGNGAAGDNYVLNGTATNGLFRYYGDLDGDGDVDGTDLVAYVPTLFNPGNYIATFDFDGDGDVDGTDLVEFVQNLFVPLP